MSKKTDQDAKKPVRRPWRDNVEAITMAIVVAVMLKYFVVEAYKIPTGSMQPTLMGNDETGIYDRILVDKFSFHYRDPQRFEVAVFKYPLDRSKNFIKRVAGVGPEWFKIEHGDLWRSDAPEDREPSASEWAVVERPRPVQEEAWKPLNPMLPGCNRWLAIGNARAWQIGPDRITAVGSGKLRFPEGGYIEDDYRDGYPQAIRQKLLSNRPSRNAVGDLRFDADVSADAALQMLVVRIFEGGREYRFEVPGPAAAEGARARIVLEGGMPANGGGGSEALAEEPLRLRAGRSQSIGVQNMDDRLVLEWGGDPVATLDVPPAVDQRAYIEVELFGAPEAGAETVLAELDEPMVYRDIYYTTQSSRMSRWYIPADHYVMLGDNTQDSSDSREWSFARFEWPGVDGVLRGNNLQTKNPFTVHGLPEGPTTWFRDEWGELWAAPARLTEKAQPPIENAPFVPRELVTGRAVVVFWPFKWDLRLWRLQWIR